MTGTPPRNFFLRLALVLFLGSGLGWAGGALDLSWDTEARAFLSYAGPWDLSSLGAGLGYGSVATSRIELSAASPPGPVRVSARSSVDATILSGVAAAPSSEAVVSARVRTAWLRLDPGWASLTAGRQILNYGPSPLWSPVDLFSSLELSGLDTVRLGVDALRLRVPFGPTGIADLVAAPTSLASEGSYALRVSGLAAEGLDLGAIAARRGTGLGQAAWMAGGDFKLDLGASFYGEATLALPDSGGDPVFRAAAGADWSLGDLILAGQYYWNGGLDPSLDPYGLGSHNVYLSLSWKATDFLNLSSRLLWNSAGDALTGTALAYLDLAQGAKASLYLSLGGKDSATSLQALLGAGLALSF